MGQVGRGNRRSGGEGRGLEQVSSRDTGAWHGVLRVGPAVGRALFWFGMKATSSAHPGLAAPARTGTHLPESTSARLCRGRADRLSGSCMPRPDGSQTALEVHIVPESMRGTGEGHYPWDLRPQSTMTNANVQQIVTAVDGPTLTVKYKDGEKKIFVPTDAPIVTYVPGDKA